MIERLRSDGSVDVAADRNPLISYDPGPPLDLVHLARQCGGDHELEEELLGLFRAQSRALVGQLSGPLDKTLESNAKIAHKLRGSALAVGAWRVAGAARAVEERASVASDSVRLSPKELADVTSAVQALKAAVAEAAREIERIRN